jgi:hypothetical protein
MNNGRKLAKVHHADLRGDRAGKYRYLSEAAVSDTPWTELTPDAPHFMFKDRDTELLPEYHSGYPIPSIFGMNGDPAPGIVTTHDDFAISWSEADATAKVERFLETTSEAEAREIFRLCTQEQWNYGRALRELKSDDWRAELIPILYRPFDVRVTVYNRNVAVHRRTRVMRHMVGKKNLGVIVTRQTKDTWGVLATRTPIAHKSLGAYDINYLFPLYLDMKPGGNGELFHHHRANFTPEFLANFSGRLQMEFVPDETGDRVNTFGPEDIFHYMYAVFHSPTYRERYAEFLTIDFPRLPLTADAALFRELCAPGAELTALHVMEAHAPIFTRYPIAGDNTVDKPRYTEPGQGASEGRVWINRTQYFEGVAPELWEHRVGGYQVAEKWLKDRKGRALTYDDLTHYQRTLAALARTVELMAAVDETIERHGGWPLAGSVPGA